MKKHLNLCLFIILVGFSSVAWAENNLYWQAIKINSHDHVEPQYGIVVRIIVPGTKACYLKGPLMDDYISGEWFEWFDAWNIQVYPISISDLQSQSFGQWELKLVFDDDQESIYTFEISGTLEDSEFLPLPDIIEPAHQASNIIGQDYVLQWDPNDAYLDAHLLMLEITGEDYSYFSSLVYFNDDLSITQWYPGWLGLGEAYTKVGYVLVRSQMIQQVSLVSGPVIDWDTTTVFLVSGAKNDFTVTHSLDFNDDGGINLIDFEVLAKTWMLVSGETGYNDHCDLIDDGTINLNDLAVFYDNWLEIGPINYHVFEIEMSLSDDYGEGYPGGVPVLVETEFDGWMQVDDTVISGTIETPGGVVYSCEMENDDGENWLGVSASSFYSENFSDFTFGTYIFTVSYNNGTSASTEIDFEFSDGAIMPPCPIVNFPVHNAVNITTPVEFQMSEICDPLWTYAIDCFPVDDIGLEDEVENIPTCGTTTLGPLVLSDGVEYEAEVTINNAIWSTNDDGIPYVVDKDSEVEIMFTTDSE